MYSSNKESEHLLSRSVTQPPSIFFECLNCLLEVPGGRTFYLRLCFLYTLPFVFPILHFLRTLSFPVRSVYKGDPCSYLIVIGCYFQSTFRSVRTGHMSAPERA